MYTGFIKIKLPKNVKGLEVGLNRETKKFFNNSWELKPELQTAWPEKIYLLRPNKNDFASGISYLEVILYKGEKTLEISINPNIQLPSMWQLDGSTREFVQADITSKLLTYNRYTQHLFSWVASEYEVTPDGEAFLSPEDQAVLQARYAPAQQLREKVHQQTGDLLVAHEAFEQKKAEIEAGEKDTNFQLMAGDGKGPTKEERTIFENSLTEAGRVAKDFYLEFQRRLLSHKNNPSLNPKPSRRKMLVEEKDDGTLRFNVSKPTIDRFWPKFEYYFSDGEVNSDTIEAKDDAKHDANKG